MPAATTFADDPKAEKILVAAFQAFMEHGYAEASMDLVANLASVSKTTLYTRFPSKQALFAATIEAECRHRGMYFSPAEFDGVEPRAALEEIGRRFIDLIWSPEAARMEQIIIGEVARFPELGEIMMREGPDKVCAAVDDYLNALKARGLLVFDNARFASEFFLTALKGLPHRCMMMGQVVPQGDDVRDEFVHRTVAMFLDGVAPR